MRRLRREETSHIMCVLAVEAGGVTWLRHVGRGTWLAEAHGTWLAEAHGWRRHLAEAHGGGTCEAKTLCGQQHQESKAELRDQ